MARSVLYSLAVLADAINFCSRDYHVFDMFCLTEAQAVRSSAVRESIYDATASFDFWS